MIPFRVFDREHNQLLVVINFHPGEKKPYLVARFDETDDDGEMRLMSPEELTQLKFVDFMDEPEDQDEE